jgi:hypothetical protein
MAPSRARRPEIIATTPVTAANASPTVITAVPTTVPAFDDTKFGVSGPAASPPRVIHSEIRPEGAGWWLRVEKGLLSQAMAVISAGELAQQFKPLAAQLKEVTGPLAGGGAPGTSSVLRLAVHTADVSELVAYLLRNFHEGALDSARRNLQIMHDLSEAMVAATRAALADCDARIPARHGHCLASVQLDDAEREWLRFRPFACNEVPEALSCDLEGGHPGSHAANAQIGNDVE